ncbi:MAG TPA: hypothetical protein VK536_00385 [Candidatus Limnocylindrales bacterium]|nr:hypothetical protein [Candidatus Limnocylindrales bacterium]
MQALPKVTISRRLIVILLVAVLALSAFNTYMILERPSGQPVSSIVSYDFVVSQSGKNYQLKNMLTGSTTSVSGDASPVINTALTQGNSVYLNPGTYSLNGDILVSNKINSKIVGDGATIIGNGHKIIIFGTNYTSSEYSTISGLTIINGTILIENSFGTTITNMIFENTSAGIELANTRSWSEDTQINNCYFINATEGVVFETPIGNATGSYASSEIDRCFFNIRDNSVGVNVERLAQFSDSQMQDVRMWMGQDGVTNQTGLLVDGSMYQTLLSGVVFESFTDVPNNMFAIDLGPNCNPAPFLAGDVNFLGNWTASIHNPYSIWISGLGCAFERQNIDVPVGVNGRYGANVTIQALPLDIYTFEPKIQVDGSFTNNETITVRIRLQFADNVYSSPVTQTFNSSGAVWLSNDQMLELFPSQSVILSVVFDATSSAGSTNAVVTVSGYGTAG